MPLELWSINDSNIVGKYILSKVKENISKYFKMTLRDDLSSTCKKIQITTHVVVLSNPSRQRQPTRNQKQFQV